MHPRRTPANERVALAELKGQVQAPRYVTGHDFMVTSPVADLMRDPDGGMDCQVLFGTGFLVLERQNGWVFGQSQADGYCGYLRENQLSPSKAITHKVSALVSHIYAAADIKSQRHAFLPFGARLSGTQNTAGFLQIGDAGFVPLQHLSPVDTVVDDFVSVIETFTGLAYLWGGNSPLGMDCSGAVQLALTAAGVSCPRDTDMQIAELGTALTASDDLRRGDLVFWQGHIGAMMDDRTLIHANAFHMKVAQEPLATAKVRILASGGGKITAIKRL